MTRVALVTFDVYSALFDIAGSLTGRLREATGLDEARAGQAFQLWRAKQMERAAISNSLGRARTSFRECTRQALGYVEQRFGLALGEGSRQELLRAWDRLTPWPEAPRVLETLASRGYPLALLSNGDRDMLQALAGRLAVPFAQVFSSEDAGTYKPHPAIYELPMRTPGLERAQVLHVAGAANDALGATAAGIRCYWSNRTGDVPLDPAYAPAFQGRNLEGLLDILP